MAKTMGRKTNRKSNPTKTRSSTSKKNIPVKPVKQAAKKKHQRLSRDQSEYVRDALNRDVDLLYNALENPSTVPSSIPKTESVVSLAESMRGLGR